MYPTVALPSQFHPHHHMDYRLNPDLVNPPYDWNAPAAVHPPLQYPRQHASYIPSNTVPRNNYQFPHPVQRSEPTNLGPLPNNFGEAMPGEHVLRRKTPNGTLTAGYDGTPSDRTAQPPASKHLLVSSLDSGQPLPSQSLPSQGNASLNDWHQPSMEPAIPVQYQSFPPSYNKQDRLGGAAVDQSAVNGSGPSWVRSSDFHPGLDSVLQQTLPPTQQPQRYYMHNGSIPTVLPATLQPCPGPTAPVGTGPYGPYWPDGAYVPYRPAAMRDSRFMPTTQYGPHQPAPHDPSFTSLPSSGRAAAGMPWVQPPLGSVNHDPLLKQQQQPQNFPPRHAPLNSLGTGREQLQPAYQTPALNTAPSGQVQVDVAGWPATSGMPPAGSMASGMNTLTQSVSNAEFKEKMLSWAHGVYVDLLATIHQTRKQNMSKPTADGQPQRPMKPSIYPKPPRQPGMDLSASQTNVQRHNGYPAQSGLTNGVSQYGAGRPSVVAGQPLDGYHAVRRASGNAFYPLVGPSDPQNSIVAEAARALGVLSSLCVESNYEWIDGMLLVGCLAYGLEDYQKASKWYSRILARDANHVEAISNLAATYLALDQHEKARELWTRAVELRPSYFEAVEHLVGLLCSNHRGREAVRIIDFVERSLRVPKNGDCFRSDELASEAESDADSTASYDRAAFDYDRDREFDHALTGNPKDSPVAGAALSGYAIPGSDNGRLLALVHAKGNMLYSFGDNTAAAAAFETAVLIAAGRPRHGIKGLIREIIAAFTSVSSSGYYAPPEAFDSNEPILLYPEKALQTASLVFPPHGMPHGLQFVPEGSPRNAAIATTSNALLSLAKIYQDGMSQASATGSTKGTPSIRNILALYYLSLSLHPSPSTANNVGILLAGIQNSGAVKIPRPPPGRSTLPEIPGVTPGSGVALALAYYNYGLSLDSRHAHLYTNLGSLLKDIGQLQPAIKMYEQAVKYDGNFDIALANLANAVKDAGRINDAITYYRRAVKVNPDFAEAVCGLANALNSVCNWTGRGGLVNTYGFKDRWHVDDQGMLQDSTGMEVGSGWMQRVVDIVNRQLKEGETWGQGLLTPALIEQLATQLASTATSNKSVGKAALTALLRSWAGQRWEGSRVVRLIERAIRTITWRWYQDRYVHGKEYPLTKYQRPQLPSTLTVPNAPTVLPFHTFTCPLTAKQVRHISQRNGLRISCSTLRSPWLPATVYPPPPPPNPYLKVGYVSSDFNNHPLAHLMQSVFGLHNPNRVKAYCYATTPSDNSVHRQQIEREAPVFYDASSWSIERLVGQIVQDGIHILVNLNGYTRGARNEVFAARPAPIHMSFMGFAGTLGAEWCDYILSDELSIPRSTLSPGQRRRSLEDRMLEGDHAEDADDWIYQERICYTRDTFFCCDHKQSAPDSEGCNLTWEQELERRWRMRKELFPNLRDDAIILGNFNQLYKIEPTTFRTWLRILARVPNAVLWLLRFPELGEHNLRQAALNWAGKEVASRIIFTDVAPKHMHISRAQVCDLFLDTPECNAHTTAADILWSGTPILTYPRYRYKMCSRMASSILTSALPKNEAGRAARAQLIATSDEDYENKAVYLCQDWRYEFGSQGRVTGRLAELRKILFTHRWESALFDTRRWVRDLEDVYDKVWDAWVRGEEGDLWL